jgi:hypothetical protein
MDFSKPVCQIIPPRFSCRTCSGDPIDADRRQRLEEAASALRAGPLGTPLRFRVVAATEDDRASLRGLGTYGFIRGATGFIVGAVSPSEKDLEDFGYTMEQLVLAATDLGLGSCWLGGTFTRSSFAKKIEKRGEESMPAVISIGMIADEDRARKAIVRRLVRSEARLAWEKLFFDGAFGTPLTRGAAGSYAEALEMVRLAPSASNRQPWRILKDGGAWHFYVARSPGYATGLASRLVKLPDLQRVDAGIAMCHFELAARERGLRGRWETAEPAAAPTGEATRYAASWRP